MALFGLRARRRTTSAFSDKADLLTSPRGTHPCKSKDLSEFRMLWSAGGFTAEHISAFGGEADILWFAHRCRLMTHSRH